MQADPPTPHPPSDDAARAPLPDYLAAAPATNGRDATRARAGAADLTRPDGLALDATGTAYRMIADYGERLLLAETVGDVALPFVLQPGGTWANSSGEATPDRGHAGATLLDWGHDVSVAHAAAIRHAAAAGTLRFADKSGANDNAAGARAREAERLGAPRAVDQAMRELLPVARAGAQRGGVGADVTLCTVADLDADPRYLGSPLGVIDLRTGDVLDARDGRLALITALTPDPYDPAATHPDVERLTAHLPTAEADWIWGSFAYALHGDASRRVIVMIGDPASGKTTLIEAIAASLGPAYMGSLGAGVLTPPRGSEGASAASPDMAGVMAPRRLTYFPEMENLRIDAARLKALVGGDVQSWRPLYAAPRQGRPTATPILIGNALPSARSGWLADPALQSRLAILDYPRPPALDPGLRGAWRMHGGDDDVEAQRRRQAIVAKLIRAAIRQTPGQPPPMPDAIGAMTRDRIDEAHGAAGAALRALVQPGERDDWLSSAALWRAVCRETGADPDAESTRIEGLRRGQLTKLAQAMFDLGRPLRRSAGRDRGWYGWRIGGETPPTEPRMDGIA